jgi:phage gp45-like
MMKLIRTIISSVIEGNIKYFAGSGRVGETFANREYMQHYGFTSRPLKDGEGLVLKQGDKVFLIASDDRRYRISLAEGEVALYTDEGDKVHLKRGGVIEIEAGTKITGKAPMIELTDEAALRRLIDERIVALFNSHTHPGVSSGSGSTGTPSTPLQLDDVSTSKVKGY